MKTGEDLSVGQAARLLKCSVNTVKRLVDSGELPGTRLLGSSHRRIKRADVIAYRDRNDAIKANNDPASGWEIAFATLALLRQGVIGRYQFAHVGELPVPLAEACYNAAYAWAMQSVQSGAPAPTGMRMFPAGVEFELIHPTGEIERIEFDLGGFGRYSGEYRVGLARIPFGNYDHWDGAKWQPFQPATN